MKEKITLQTPAGTLEGVLFEYLSEKGRGGCQGFVRPALISVNGVEKIVQVKRFYKNSVDDRGDAFSQDPEKSAQENYQNLVNLSKKGFKVVPYFALGTTAEGKVLVLEDLTKNGQLEVYDEKELHRVKDVSLMLQKCVNWSEVALEFLRTSLLQTFYHLTLGFGVSDMFVRDPKTNRIENFITDVGECYGDGWPGDLSKILKSEDFKPSRPLAVFGSLIGDQDLAEKLFEKIDPVKKEFMNLVHQAYVSHSFWTGLEGGSIQDFAVDNFVKKDFHDHSLYIKTLVKRAMTYYESLRGQALFEWDEKAKTEFLTALNSPDEKGLIKGIDYAYLICLDRDLFYLDQIRQHGQVVEREPLPDQISDFKFLDRSEEEVKKPVLLINCRNDFSRDAYRKMAIKVDWLTGFKFANHSTFPLFVYPGQIKAVYDCRHKPLTDNSYMDRSRDFIIKKLIPGFDLKKIHVEVNPYTAFYLHDDLLFHEYSFEMYKEIAQPSLDELRKIPGIRIWDKSRESQFENKEFPPQGVKYRY